MYIKILLPLFISFFFNDTCGERRLSGAESLFVSWNKLTLRSLEKQVITSKDSLSKKLYENRLQTFPGLIEIDNENTVNPNSIRYSFVKLIYNQISSAKGNFLIVETRKTGEAVSLRNYFILLDDETIQAFDYQKLKWVINPNIHDGQPLLLDMDIDKYRKSFGSGANDDDVIITSISKQKVVKSEYYLFETLSSEVSQFFE